MFLHACKDPSNNGLCIISSHFIFDSAPICQTLPYLKGLGHFIPTLEKHIVKNWWNTSAGLAYLLYCFQGDIKQMKRWSLSASLAKLDDIVCSQNPPNTSLRYLPSFLRELVSQAFTRSEFKKPGNDDSLEKFFEAIPRVVVIVHSKILSLIFGNCSNSASSATFSTHSNNRQW